MAFFRKHKGRASYELFTGYSHYLPGIGGMMMLFLLFILGSLLGSLLSGLFNLAMGPSELVESYSMLIAYPVSFIPPLLYASMHHGDSGKFPIFALLRRSYRYSYKLPNMIFFAL